MKKEVLMSCIYDGMDDPEEKILPIFVRKLRVKLASASNGKTFIQTVHGQGYKLREPRADDPPFVTDYRDRSAQVLKSA